MKNGEKTVACPLGLSTGPNRMNTLAQKLWIGLLGLISLTLAGCTPNLGQNSRYGMYGGQQQRAAASGEKPFSITDTFIGVRWFPAHVRFSPDDSNLLVSLCHNVPERITLCRVGRYHIATKEWEILPFEDKRTYRWPTYTPDGKWIVFSTGPCDEQYRCSIGDYVLARMPADGSRMEVVADTIAREPSFAPDGKKLVYWKVRPRVEHLYEMDWETRQERELVNMASAPASETGRPFLIEGGKAVVFYGRINVGFEHRGLIRVDIADRPLQSAYDLDRLSVIWPVGISDHSPSGVNDVFDVARDGRLLYRSWLSGRKPHSTEGRRTGLALYISSPRPASIDDKYADFNIQFLTTASLSSDAKRIAFTDVGSTGFTPTKDDSEWQMPQRWIQKGLGIIAQGDREPTLIDWPRLELKTGRIQSANR